MPKQGSTQKAFTVGQDNTKAPIRKNTLSGVQLRLTPKQATSPVIIRLRYVDHNGLKQPFIGVQDFTLPIGHITSIRRAMVIGAVYQRIGYNKAFRFRWPDDLQSISTIISGKTFYKADGTGFGVIQGPGDLYIWGNKLSETYDTKENRRKDTYDEFQSPRIDIVIRNRHQNYDGSPSVINPNVQLQLPAFTGKSYLEMFDEECNKALQAGVRMLEQPIASQPVVDLERMPPPANLQRTQFPGPMMLAADHQQYIPQQVQKQTQEHTQQQIREENQMVVQNYQPDMYSTGYLPSTTEYFQGFTRNDTQSFPPAASQGQRFEWGQSQSIQANQMVASVFNQPNQTIQAPIAQSISRPNTPGPQPTRQYQPIAALPAGQAHASTQKVTKPSAQPLRGPPRARPNKKPQGGKK